MSISQSQAAARHAVLPSRGAIGVLFAEADRYAGQIVSTALERSFTTAQVTIHGESPSGPRPAALVWINPPDSARSELAQAVSAGGKAVVCGRLGPRIAELLGLDLRGPIDLPREWAWCACQGESRYDESPAAIRYRGEHPLVAESPFSRRALCRFDFAEEWNNLGFGRMALSGDAWSLASAVEIGAATSVAQLVTPTDDRLVYAALRESDAGALLWFNRPVGPVDSLEWRVVEAFLGDYRGDDLACFPYVSEIPAGYRGAVCARLDCDEAVASARPLVELYGDFDVPLSLALLTGQPVNAADIRVLRMAMAAGGSVVPHSEHHFPNWGGSYERACAEAAASRAWFDQRLPDAGPARYAVSPFHQNPPYAVQALADCGFEGFVGGIIANDPEYLLGRAGRVPFASRLMVSHSAQCMLHGDCFRRYGDSVDTYRESFDRHVAARSIFGYLDHPFSARYQYGWPDEATRAGAHRLLIEHMRARPDIWWASVNDVLDFLVRRDRTQLAVDEEGQLAIDASQSAADRPLSIHWKGREIVA